ncbi:preprotein translocase subunit YajC [Geodermatophilus obscurus]|uniref:Preprotein translocase, YajC subunit n=1 Tax=Geodermatophilus obscurus (strain ATCC 25078 / DSM 43160 / JCM 3152 / CCUG 61914 / KCC A-0152 / KCTC 9177 / NBRC 13315 / NRRL B-3577 / G-20) TaxID=526225 RepID=D2S9I1_GEOOG|nr:preprotein translocase subunit YajC [Geodermatophilus obscurus]ADB75781.1 preprotein translocase, YajC subunit [Geodermatophilus obscurus DSM 43160]
MELFPLVILVLAFVLLIVLPARQRKKSQEQQRMLQESLTPGTPVMTTAGLHGTVAALGEGTVDLEIAPGVVVTFARQAVLEIRKPAVADGPVLPGDDADGGPADRTR